MPLMLIGVFGGLALALIMTFKKPWSPWLAPAFALLKLIIVGLSFGVLRLCVPHELSRHRDASGGLTLIVALVMFVLYQTRIIRVTNKFRSVITIATISLAVFYLVKLISSLVFGASIGAFTNASTPLGIGFSIVVVCLAALNLLLDFDMIEKGVETGAPKYMEWYGAFGLLVTLVWLYLEILRLLSRLKDR